ncbi:MAG: N-acyl-D-amino-acid deacylase family protein [Bacteroidota bacterium]
MKNLFFLCSFLLLFSCADRYDVIIRGGTVYDGTGASGLRADVGINADTVAFIGDLSAAKAAKEIDATGKAVTPGFINMLSWAVTSLILDGNGESDIRQGVTLEVFGEGQSLGPINDKMKEEMQQSMKRSPEYAFDVNWTTLGQYLDSLTARGVSPNVASFIGATTVRIHELGEADRAPSPEELERMRGLVKVAMEEGALGVGSSLIYAPAFYASTEELIELCKVAAGYGGMYITHMRSEGNSIEKAVAETIRISREAGLPAEIYHFKFSGKDNWKKVDDVVAMIEAARKEGLRITADMYTYPAGATGLDAAMPPWIQEGGLHQWIARMKDPVTRARALKDMRTPTNDWENLMRLADGPDKVLLLEFSNDSLAKMYTGKTLAEVSKRHGKSPEETAMDLVIADSTRVGTAYFLMNEDNISKQFALPWVSLGSDAGAPATTPLFTKSSEHPRAYGNFARFLAKYVREEKVMPLEEGIHRLSGLPASNLGIRKRGTLAVGNFADVNVFDPAVVQDHATFDKPHQYSTGMSHVFVNGVQVLKDGEHTNARPGRVVRGPGYKGK